MSSFMHDLAESLAFNRPVKSVAGFIRVEEDEPDIALCQICKKPVKPDKLLCESCAINEALDGGCAECTGDDDCECSCCAEKARQKADADYDRMKDEALENHRLDSQTANRINGGRP